MLPMHTKSTRLVIGPVDVMAERRIQSRLDAHSIQRLKKANADPHWNSKSPPSHAQKDPPGGDILHFFLHLAIALAWEPADAIEAGFL